MGEPAWSDVDLDRVPDRAPAAVGGRLLPDPLLDAYRAGFFPFPTEDPRRRRLHRSLWGADVAAGRIAALMTADEDEDPFGLVWWHPEKRPVIPARSLHLGDRVRRRLRHTSWSSTLDADFVQVLDACADREPRWLTDDLQHALADLHGAGWCYSCEVWDEAGLLVGGLFGSAFGNLVTIDSVFHREPDGGTAAIFALADRARHAGEDVLLDFQWPQDFHRRLGVNEVSRSEFLASVTRVDRHLELDPARRPITACLDGWG